MSILLEAILGGILLLIEDLFRTPYGFPTMLIAGLLAAPVHMVVRKALLLQPIEPLTRYISWSLTGILLGVGSAAIRLALPLGLGVLSPTNIIALCMGFGLPGAIAGILIARAPHAAARIAGSCGLVCGVIYHLRVAQSYYIASSIAGFVLGAVEFFAPPVFALLVLLYSSWLTRRIRSQHG